MTKLGKEEYEGKMLLKPYHKKDNPDGVKDIEEGIPVTVRKVEKVKLPKTGDTWLITFREYPDAALALNKTNLKKLVDLFGDETDEWLKEKVKLIVVMANNPQGGGDVPSLRIKAKDWKYGDDEGEHEEDDETEQPVEPVVDEVEEKKVKEIQDRRKK